jgi:hypothetical protein
LTQCGECLPKIANVLEAVHPEIRARRLEGPPERLSAPCAFVDEQDYDLSALSRICARAMRAKLTIRLIHLVALTIWQKKILDTNADGVGARPRKSPYLKCVGGCSRAKIYQILEPEGISKSY